MKNLTSESIPLIDYQIVFSEGDIYTIVEGALDAGKLKTLSEKDLGFSPGNNDRIFLFDPSGQLIDARKVTGKLRGRSEEFNGEWLYPSLPTFGSANKFSFERDVVINEIMYHPRPEPEVPDTEAIYDSTTLLDWGATWRYNESGPELGGSWQDQPHAVGGDWKFGIGPLGWDSTTNKTSLEIGIDVTNISVYRRIRMALEEVGPAFVKLGQSASTRIRQTAPSSIKCTNLRATISSMSF
jgi:hypothetical protein